MLNKGTLLLKELAWQRPRRGRLAPGLGSGLVWGPPVPVLMANCWWGGRSVSSEASRSEECSCAVFHN